MAVQAIGQRVRREEDFRLLTGRGRYVDDVPAIGPHGEPAARGYVLRSPHAHARIVSIDAEQAKTAPGVLAVLTGDDLKRRGLGTLRPRGPDRRRSKAARPRHLAAARAAPEKEWRPCFCLPAAAPRTRPCPFCRRLRRLYRRRNAEQGEGRGRTH